MYLKTPFCNDQIEIATSQLQSDEIVSCHCGYRYRVIDLVEFQRLTDRQAKLQSEISTLVKSMIERRRDSQDEQGSESASTFANYPPVVSRQSDRPAAQGSSANEPPVYVPKPARATRARAAISTQQWLIIGASILVFVAASVFVGNYINKISSEGFLAITLGVSAATGFVGFKSRKLSVLLSNFTAAFSSAMLMMAMLIIGDMIYPFAWNTAPADWWAVALIVVAASSAALAKLSSNFGWKAISPLAFTFAGLAFTYGTVGTWIANSENAYPWTLLSLSVTAIALLYLIRFIKAIPHPAIDKEENRAYEEDLERREVAALGKYAQFATILLGVFSVGVVLSQTLSILSRPIDALSSLVLGVVWLAGAQTIDRWGGPLSSSGDVPNRLRLLAWLLGTVNLALGLNALALETRDVWVATWLSLAAAAALFALPAAKRFIQVDHLAQTVAIWVSLGSFVLWNIMFGTLVSVVSPEGDSDPLIRSGVYLVGFSILFVLSNLLADKPRSALTAIILNSLGTLLLVLGLKTSTTMTTATFIGWTSALIVSIALFNLLQRWVAQRGGFELERFLPVFAAVQLGVIGVILLTLNPTETTRELLVPVSLILLAEAAVLRLLAGRVKVIAKLELQHFANLQSWVLQGLVGALVLSGLVSDTYQNNSPKLLLVLMAAAAINYLFAMLDKVLYLFTIGFVLTNLGLVAGWSAYQQVLDQVGVPASNGLAFVTAILFSVAVAFTHRLLTNRFAAPSSTAKYVAGLAGPLGVLGGSLLLQSPTLVTMESTDFWILQATLVALALSGSAITLTRKNNEGQHAAGLIPIASLGYALASFVPLTNSEILSQRADSLWHLLIAAVAIALVTVSSNRKTPSIGWLAGSYLGLLLTAHATAELLRLAWNSDLPEINSVLYAVAVSLASLLSGTQLGRLKKHFVLDAPVAVAALYSVTYALSSISLSDETQIRLTVGFLVLAALTHWRTITERSLVWLVGAYGFGFFAFAQLATAIRHFAGITADTPELYGYLIAAAVVTATLVSGDLLGGLRKYALLDVPVLIAAIIPLGYALSFGADQGVNLIRAMTSLFLIAALSAWRTYQTKSWFWLAATYATGAGFALTLGRQLSQSLKLGDDYPEAYSLTLTAVLLGVNVLLPRVQKQNTTLITWGLPVATLLLPSALATATTIDQGFVELSTLQQVRTIAVLLISILVFVFGVLRGNLGLTVVGVTGLSLVAWVRVQGTETTSFELRSLIIAFVLFVILGLIKKSTQAQGNSIIYIGIPVAVALTPPLYNTLAALGHPTLQLVDWWRFAIVLAASLTLLIVGSLREQAGMFFPGLIGVLVTVLPYGINRVSSESWFLWVVLLLVAGVMVWIAVRLEQMRKVGKNSVAWIKALK
mgnify:CR=1 FL=1